MLLECLMNVCQRKSFMENYKSNNAHMVVGRSDIKTPSKPAFNIPTEAWEQITQDRTKKRVLVITKQKESAKPSRNVRSGKPELRHNQQSFLPQTSLVLSATGSLELRLFSSAILENTNTRFIRIYITSVTR